MHIEDVRREIGDARSQKDKELMTSHTQPKPDNEAKTPEQKREAFLKAVSADNYVKEAMSVIRDMITVDASCLSVTAK